MGTKKNRLNQTVPLRTETNVNMNHFFISGLLHSFLQIDSRKYQHIDRNSSRNRNSNGEKFLFIYMYLNFLTSKV